MHASYALHGVLAGLVSAAGQPLVITSAGLPFEVSSELAREVCVAVRAQRLGGNPGAAPAEGQLAALSGRYQVLYRFSAGSGQVAAVVASPTGSSTPSR